MADIGPNGDKRRDQMVISPATADIGTDKGLAACLSDRFALDCEINLHEQLDRVLDARTQDRQQAHTGDRERRLRHPAAAPSAGRLPGGRRRVAPARRPGGTRALRPSEGTATTSRALRRRGRRITRTGFERRSSVASSPTP